jgi:hypothetical protein
MSMPVSGTFEAFSRFRLNTSKSANTKVIRRFEGQLSLLAEFQILKYWSSKTQAKAV